LLKFENDDSPFFL